MENIKAKFISLYEELETFLRIDDENVEDLRNELQVSNPNYLTVLGKWRNDLESCDHGIVVSGITLYLFKFRCVNLCNLLMLDKLMKNK